MNLYRVDSGYRHRRDVTAADVVRHEQDDLGNNLHLIVTEEYLERFHGNDLAWFTLNKKDARRYGKPVTCRPLPAGALIIGYDLDGGILVLGRNLQK